MSDIKKTEDIFLKLIAATKNINDLEAIRIKALGKKGEVTKLMKTISLMEEEERRTKAPLLNALKDKIIENIEKKKLSINTDILNEKISTEWLDISRPSRSRQKGKIHPISQVTEEIVEIFSDTLLGRSIHESFQLEIRLSPHSLFITFSMVSLVFFESIPKEFPSKYNLSSG